MATRYRDLQQPTMLQPGVVDSGGAETAARLADAFKSFENTAAGFGRQLFAQKGAEEGATAGATGQPELRTGFKALTAYGQAYNNAALRSYAIQADIELQETAARLEMEAGNNPDVFRERMQGALTGIQQQAPAGTASLLNELWNQRIAQGSARLVVAQTAEIREQQTALLYEGLDRMAERVGDGIAANDPTQRITAEIEQQKAELLILGAVEDGTLSETKADALRKNFLSAVTQRTVVSRFEQELNDPYGDPAGFILNLKRLNQESEALTSEEEQKIEASLLAELRDHNALRSAQESAETAGLKAKYAAGEKAATEALLSGTLTRRQILAMVRNDDLDPTVARTLQNELESGTGSGSSDQMALALTTLNVLEYTEEQIWQNGKLSLKDRTALIQKRRDLADTWRSTQQAKEGADRIKTAFRIVPGQFIGLLDEDTARAVGYAQQEWYDRVEALPEHERQSQMIPLANEIAGRVGKDKDLKDKIRARREFKVSKDPTSLSGEQLRKYEETLRQYDAEIASLKQGGK